jgi:hypothetical protein
LSVMAKLKAAQQANPYPGMSPHQAAPDGSLAIPMRIGSMTGPCSEDLSVEICPAKCY